MSSSSRNSANPAKSLFSTLKDDFGSVRKDIGDRGVGRALGGTLESVESFYLTDGDRQRLAKMAPVGRFFHRTWWLFRSLLFKLTPARRIMLAFAVWFLLAPNQIRLDSVRVSLQMPWFGSAILLTILMLELKDKLVARDELEAGRQVQLALMPDESPEIPGWDVWLYTQPANDVGGDLVDHLKLDEQRHVIMLGDVAGKALPAALLSVKLQATLRALAPRFDSLGDLGADLNRILFRDGLPTRFASLVYLVLNADSNHVRVLNAGHMPPLVVRAGSVMPMERGSMVLGIMPDVTYTEQAVDLNRGDTLVVYSDGVSEAMNEAGDFFGDERLVAAIMKTDGLPAVSVGASILASVRGFVGDAVRNDDVSLMVLRRH